jgi:hypothetical protein
MVGARLPWFFIFWIAADEAVSGWARKKIFPRWRKWLFESESVVLAISPKSGLASLFKSDFWLWLGSMCDRVLSCRTGPLRVGRPFHGFFPFCGIAWWWLFL